MSKLTIKCTLYKIYSLSALFMLINITSGCSGLIESFGKGVTEAILEDAKKNDRRKCKIWSEGFKGIGHNIDEKSGQTKVLMVHGVTRHVPGYSTKLMEKLAKKLNLEKIVVPQKNLTLTDGEKDDDGNLKNLGNLRVTKLMSKDKKRSMLFYELTWSRISDEEKKVLTFESIRHGFI